MTGEQSSLPSTEEHWMPRKSSLSSLGIDTYRMQQCGKFATFSETAFLLILAARTDRDWTRKYEASML